MSSAPSHPQHRHHRARRTTAKTTLVDAILAQSGDAPRECRGSGRTAFLDSNPLERERGITILSKNCAVDWDLRGWRDAPRST